MTDQDEAEVADVIVAAIKFAVAPLIAEQRRLVARVAELEARPTMKHVGTWKTGTTYAAGDCVTYRGSVWHCLANHVSSQPDVDHVCWQLIVKAGRDGEGREMTDDDDVWAGFNLETPPEAIDRAIEANVRDCVECAREHLTDPCLTDAQIARALAVVEETARRLAREAFASNRRLLLH